MAINQNKNSAYKNYMSLAAFAACYFLLARFGMSVLALHPANITLLWLPAGIGFWMCLRWRLQALPWIVVASFAANYDGMAALGSARLFMHTLFSALIDGGTSMLAATLYRRLLPDGMQHPNDVLRLCVGVGVLPAALSGALLALNLVAGGYIVAEHAPSFIGILTVADSLGILMVFPIFHGWVELARVSRGCLSWLLGLSIALCVVVAAGLSVLPGLLFFVLPILLLLSLNVQLLGVAVVSAVSLSTIIAGTARGLGPLVADSAADTHFRLMAFCFSVALTVLGMVFQRRQLMQSEHSNNRWRDIAEHDPLTGLINRRFLLPRLENEHQRVLRGAQAYTLVMLDLDHFKTVNDTYGHAAGDAVLQALADVLQQNCRSVDTVARIGGEEFCILLPECSVAQAGVAMERLRAAIERAPHSWSGHLIQVTVSIGLAALADASEPVSRVMSRADKALYAAKRAGRNRVLIDEVER